MIERVFGVVKEKFPILKQGSEYTIRDQCRVIIAVCIFHNAIATHEGVDLHGEELFPSIRMAQDVSMAHRADAYEVNDPKRKQERIRAREEAEEALRRTGVSTWGKTVVENRKQCDKMRDRLAGKMWRKDQEYGHAK